MISVGIISILLFTAVYVGPAISAKNISIITGEGNENKNLVSLGDEQVPEEYIEQFNGLLTSIVDNDGKAFEAQLIGLYAGIEEDFKGVQLDLEEIYGSKFTNAMDILFGIETTPDVLSAESDAMKKINNIRKDVLSKSDKDSYAGQLKEAKEMDISFEDFPADFDAETYAQEIKQIINENKAMNELSGFVIDKINDGKNDSLDLLKLVLQILWIVVWTGSSFLPGFTTVTAVVGMAVSILVGAAIALALEEVGVTGGIADVIRSLFPSWNAMSELAYEGAISFIVGGIVFTSYILAFTATRVVKFLTAPAVAIAVLVGIHVVIEDLKKKEGKPRSAEFSTLDMPLIKIILSRFLQKFTAFKAVFNLM